MTYSVSDSNTSQRGKEIIWAGHYICLGSFMDSNNSHSQGQEYQ